MFPVRLTRLFAVATALVLPACDGPQSALSTAGREAERIAHLFWWMASGAVLVWILVIGIALYALSGDRRRHEERLARLFIIGGGVILPTSVLTVLLVYGLWLMADVRPPPRQRSEILEIEVSGERWWWRVRYALPGGGSVELANEIRLPVGEPVQLRLVSPDVIHSFWVPSLAGKMDMIPGRVNYLILEPTRTGVFRGACAEYCGSSHALMSFYVLVVEREEFQDWLDHQQSLAAPPRAPRAVLGQSVFLESGCGACHTIRGTPADGVLGPDLTHVGARVSLAAGTLPNEPPAFERWIALTRILKPNVEMPHFAMLPEEELSALAVYLESLQ